MKKCILSILLTAILMVSLIPFYVEAKEEIAPGLYVREAMQGVQNDNKDKLKDSVELQYPYGGSFSFIYFDGKTEMRLSESDLICNRPDIVTLEDDLDYIFTNVFEVGRAKISYTAPNGTKYSVSVNVSFPEVAFFTSPDTDISSYVHMDIWNVNTFGNTMYIISTTGKPFKEIQPEENWPESSITLSDDRTVAEIQLLGQISNDPEIKSYIKCIFEDGIKVVGKFINDNKFEAFDFDFQRVRSECVCTIDRGYHIVFHYYDNQTTYSLTDYTVTKEDIVVIEPAYEEDGTINGLIILGKHCGSTEIILNAPDGTTWSFPITVELEPIDFYTSPVASEDAIADRRMPVLFDNPEVHIVSTAGPIIGIEPGETWPESNIVISDDNMSANIEIFGELPERYKNATIIVRYEDNGLTISEMLYMSFVDMRFDSTTGDCSDNLVWEFDKNTRTLTISGTGKTDDYAPGEGAKTMAPWERFFEAIENVVIEEGLEYLGSGAFVVSNRLKSVKFPVSMTAIGDLVFNHNEDTIEVYYAGSESQWKQINIGEGNYALEDANMHFCSDGSEDMCTHKPEAVVGKSPTCTEPGLTDGAKCSVCSEVLIVQEEIPALGHKFADGMCNLCGAADPDSVEPTHPAGNNPFTDVKSSDWFFNSVMWAKDAGVTGGTSATTFGPNDSCTRAQVVTFIWAANGKPESQTIDNPFTDVKDSDWFYQPVLWAVENGITGGISKTEFGPNQTCTRAQVVTFLYAAAGKPAISEPIEFTDVKYSDWFTNPIIWAVENDVTSGIGNSQFGPNQICTRAQVVTFLYKVYSDK